MLAFFGLLRPTVRRKDTSLPSDHFKNGVLYIRVGGKNKFRGNTPNLSDWTSQHGCFCQLLSARLPTLVSSLVRLFSGVTRFVSSKGCCVGHPFWNEDLSRLQYGDGGGISVC